MTGMLVGLMFHRLRDGGVAFFWAALVLILAVGRGYVSRWLCHPWLVRLG